MHFCHQEMWALLALLNSLPMFALLLKYWWGKLYICDHEEHYHD